jgi:excisionase family DNA binding protein
MAAKREDIMTMDELAEYLKISKSTLYKLAVENKLPGTKIGKRWRFHRDAIDRWVQSGNLQGDSDTKPGDGQ